ncbi:alpha/beta hydrolase family protein [Streptomyces sp. NPDC087420]|uniref:alpha/beta hydrolase family protein n=1 Tax=Streptomyces sp. NPDC087420 TaxID=3365785 RepID=UPI003837FA1B
MRPVLFADDRQFWFETLRILGHAAYGGSDIGEVLTTAEAITSADYDSWHDAWRATADRVGAEAAAGLAAGHRVSARDGMLRAATYYSTAEFFLHGDPGDPRINDAYERGAACFATAAGLYRPAIEPVRIPYEGTVLEGWFYRPSLDGAPRPTVVMHNGFDGSAEELHYLGGLAALDRGYNALSFDGPGQPSAIHRRGLVLRPDWEHVVGPVLDHLETLPGVDHDRVALMGVSLGGMLAPRAAAHEPRLAAVVVVDGVYDAAEALTGLLPLPRAEVERRARADHDPAFDDLLERAAADSPTLRWAFGHGRYATGSATSREFLARYLDYHLRDGVAERVSCPVLVCSAGDDLFFAGDGTTKPQPQELYDHLTAPADLRHFTAAEGADAHGHAGAERLAMARVFDWLDTTLGHADDGRPDHTTSAQHLTEIS